MQRVFSRAAAYYDIGVDRRASNAAAASAAPASTGVNAVGSRSGNSSGSSSCVGEDVREAELAQRRHNGAIKRHRRRGG